MLLIGMFDSPFVRRVAVTMKLLEMPFEHANWSIGRDFDRIREYNPLGRVPTLVTREGEKLMPGNVTFKTASADLNSNFYKVLDSVALVLKEFDKTLIDVEGHTDSDGSDEYNQQLSMQRATSVGAYLQSHGVNSQRVVALGVGESRPIANNGTPEGKQQNRRVELKLQPIVRG